MINNSVFDDAIKVKLVKYVLSSPVNISPFVFKEGDESPVCEISRRYSSEDYGKYISAEVKLFKNGEKHEDTNVIKRVKYIISNL